MEDVRGKELANEFVEWVLERKIEGCEIKRDADGAAVTLEGATGYVRVYDLDGNQVVEMRLEDSGGETLFFLHFELEELARAKTMFREMEEAIQQMQNRAVRHVLLCCTCGITTTFFSNKLNETARALGIDFDFRAMPIEEARKSGENYAAVLLAPQVGHQRGKMADELPGTVVIELPGKIFGAFDAAGALRLVMDALAEREAKESTADDTLRAGREASLEACVLSISIVSREQRECTLSYRIFDHGKTSLSGQILRKKMGVEDVVGLLETIRDSGWDLDEFDAIGIALPARVSNGEAVSDAESQSQMAMDFGQAEERFFERLGKRVVVHNAGLAAAASCFLAQSKFESIAFHAQVLGNYLPTEGFVLNGRPYQGYAGMAGHLGHIMVGLSDNNDLEMMSWRYKGVIELVTRYVACIACTIAPEAVYVFCDLLPDIDEVSESLSRILPADAMPELIAISDYEDCVLVGEMALCLDELKPGGRLER